MTPVIGTQGSSIVHCFPRYRCSMTQELHASVEQIAWPAVMTGMAAQLFALQRQFDETQFWGSDRLRVNQFRQLQILLRHAGRNVPFYKNHLQQVGINPDAELT